MRVLVTGASGLLGGAVADLVARQGHDVVLLQRRPAGRGWPEVLGDVADRAAVGRAVAGADAVIHLAAKVSVTGPWREFLRTNVVGTRVLLDAARAAGCRRFVYVSSPSVAHAGRSLVGAPAGPADARAARGSYARSKAMAEGLALAADGPGLAAVAVRPHLVWGPGDTQLVGRIVARGRAGRLAVVGGGAALIDTTYVDNAAAAIAAALDRAERPDVRGRAFVVSNGEPRPVREMLESLCLASGVDPGRLPSVPLPVALAAGAAAEALWTIARRQDDPPLTRFLAEQLATAHWFDQRATRGALAWAPAVGIDEGLARLAAASGAAGISPGRRR